VICCGCFPYKKKKIIISSMKNLEPLPFRGPDFVVPGYMVVTPLGTQL